MERYKVKAIAITSMLILIISMFRFIKTRSTIKRLSVVIFFLEELDQSLGKISRITMMFLMTMPK